MLMGHIVSKEPYIYIYDYNRKVGANFFLLTSDYGHDAIGTDLSINLKQKGL